MRVFSLARGCHCILGKTLSDQLRWAILKSVFDQKDRLINLLLKVDLVDLVEIHKTEHIERSIISVLKVGRFLGGAVVVFLNLTFSSEVGFKTLLV